MNVQLDLRMDGPEFLAWVQAHEGRYELVRGRVVMIKPGDRAVMRSCCAGLRLPLKSAWTANDGRF